MTPPPPLRVVRINIVRARDRNLLPSVTPILLRLARHPTAVESESQLAPPATLTPTARAAARRRLSPHQAVPRGRVPAVVTMSRPPTPHSPRRVMGRAAVTRGRTEAFGVETLEAELAELVRPGAEHTRRASHARPVPLLPTLLALRVDLLDRTAVRDEPPDLPVDAVVVAEVGRRTGGEFLVEGVAGLADGCALLAERRVVAVHPPVLEVGHIVALGGNTVLLVPTMTVALGVDVTVIAVVVGVILLVLVMGRVCPRASQR